MSTVASRRARDVLRNATKVVAIDLLSSAQALSFRLDENTDASLGQGVSQGLDNVTRFSETISHPYTTIGEQIEILSPSIQTAPSWNLYLNFCRPQIYMLHWKERYEVTDLHFQSD